MGDQLLKRYGDKKDRFLEKKRILGVKSEKAHALFRILVRGVIIYVGNATILIKNLNL